MSGKTLRQRRRLLTCHDCKLGIKKYEGGLLSKAGTCRILSTGNLQINALTMYKKKSSESKKFGINSRIHHVDFYIVYSL